MLKKILLPLITSISLNASANTDFIKQYGSNGWEIFYENVSEKSYTNKLSIKRGNGFTQIIEMRDFSTEQMDGGKFIYKSKFHLYEFDCTNQTFKVLYTQTRSKNFGKGNAVYEDTIPTPTFEKIKEGSPVLSLWRIACKAS